MRFLDSNILAYAFYDNENRERSQTILSEGGVTNTINLIEAHNILQYETTRERATQTIRSLLKSNLTILNVDINLVFEALRRADKYPRLKFLDLIHYVSALLNNCTEIASYDTDFDNLEIKRIT